MTFEAAKTKLTELKEQITRHNTNIKKYNDKKQEIFNKLADISILINQLKNISQGNPEAERKLKELIETINAADFPTMEAELKDNELQDVLKDLIQIETDLKAFIDGSGGGDGDGGGGGGGESKRDGGGTETKSRMVDGWHEMHDDTTGRTYYWNTQTNATQWVSPDGDIINKDHHGHHSKHRRGKKAPPQQLVEGGRRRRTRKRRKRKRKRGGFKFTTDAIKSRKSRFMTRKRKSRTPKRTRRKRRKRRRRGRKSRRR